MSLVSEQTPAREYATRPADERFPDANALVAQALIDKNHSVERTYNLKDLQVVPSIQATDTGVTLYGGGRDATFVAMQEYADGTIAPVPLAYQFTGNPYKELNDPTKG